MWGEVIVAGEWIWIDFIGIMAEVSTYECSECGERFLKYEIENVCPRCGSYNRYTGRRKEEEVELTFIDTFGEDDLEFWNKLKDAYEEEIQRIYEELYKYKGVG